MTGPIDYDALSAMAEAGELQPAPNGPARTGAAAAAYGRAILRAATGADTDADALHLALGRPRLDRKDADRPVVKVRLTPALDQAVRARARADNQPISEVVRRAICAYTTNPNTGVGVGVPG